jgi:hypothetical protein
MTFCAAPSPNATKVAELREEVTQVRVAAVMAGARTARAEKMAQERGVLLATAHGEVDTVAQRVSALEGELVAVHQARDAAEAKLPSLAAKVVAVDQRWVAVEEQCEHLVHELTLLNLRGFELCMTITGAPS